MSKRHIIESFNSIRDFLNTIESREQNKVMRYNYSSKDGSKSFTGTSSYEESRQLILEGYKDVLPKVKDEVKKQKELNKHLFGYLPKNRPMNSIVGYVPNVPNYLSGIPESMIGSNKIPKKQKCIDIIYAPVNNCNARVEEFIEAGVKILTCVEILESNGYSVRLCVSPKCSYTGKENCLCYITLKNFDERLDLLKIAFPICHPSFLRRFGFKWLETNEQIEFSGWSSGYGSSYTEAEWAISELELKEHNKFGKFFVMGEVKRNSVETLLKQMEVLK